MTNRRPARSTKMPPVKHNANAARPSGWTSPGDHHAWSIRSVLAPTAIAAVCARPRLRGRAHGVECRSRNAVFGPHLRRSVRNRPRPAAHRDAPESSARRPSLSTTAPTTRPSSTVNSTRLVFRWAVTAGLSAIAERKRPMTRPTAGEQVGLRRTEAFVVQRSTDQSLESAKAVVGHRLRDDVTHAVVARAGHRAVVVRPRQDLEREVLVAARGIRSARRRRARRSPAARQGCGRRRRRGSSAGPRRWCRHCPRGRVRGCRGYHIPPPPE